MREPDNNPQFFLACDQMVKSSADHIVCSRELKLSGMVPAMSTSLRRKYSSAVELMSDVGTVPDVCDAVRLKARNDRRFPTDSGMCPWKLSGPRSPRLRAHLK